MALKEKRAWKTGLLDMTAEPDGTNRCCYTFVCSPCAYGKMAENPKAPEGVPGKGSCVQGAMCFMLFPHLVQAFADHATRESEGIQGNCFFDIVDTVFCLPCQMCRQSREIDLKSA